MADHAPGTGPSGEPAMTGQGAGADHSGKIRENGAPNPLTGIPPRIHCGPAQETGDSDEAERLMVRHFLETLAGVALSVASRKTNP
jgi:hypothetical protein